MRKAVRPRSFGSTLGTDANVTQGAGVLPLTGRNGREDIPIRKQWKPEPATFFESGPHDGAASVSIPIVGPAGKWTVSLRYEITGATPGGLGTVNRATVSIGDPIVTYQNYRPRERPPIPEDGEVYGELTGLARGDGIVCAVAASGASLCRIWVSAELREAD